MHHSVVGQPASRSARPLSAPSNPEAYLDHPFLTSLRGILPEIRFCFLLSHRRFVQAGFSCVLNYVCGRQASLADVITVSDNDAPGDETREQSAERPERLLRQISHRRVSAAIFQEVAAQGRLLALLPVISWPWTPLTPPLPSVEVVGLSSVLRGAGREHVPGVTRRSTHEPLSRCPRRCPG